MATLSRLATFAFYHARRQKFNKNGFYANRIYREIVILNREGTYELNENESIATVNRNKFDGYLAYN